jgi:hypothetical protein
MLRERVNVCYESGQQVFDAEMSDSPVLQIAVECYARYRGEQNPRGSNGNQQDRQSAKLARASVVEA